MTFNENEEFDLQLENRLNLQFSIGILGVLIGFVSGVLSLFYNILIQTNSPSEWSNFISVYFTQNILALYGYIFVMVGLLALFKKHNFNYMWVFVILILENLIFIMFNPYLVQWFEATYGDFSVYQNFSIARTLLKIIILAGLTFSIRDSVRNKFLIWTIILGGALTLGFNYLLWYILYGPGPLINAPALTTLPYLVGSYLFAKIFSIFEILLFVDERKYSPSTYHETIVIGGEFDT